MRKQMLKGIVISVIVFAFMFQTVGAATFDSVSGLDASNTYITVKGIIDKELPERPVNVQIDIGNTTLYAEQLLTGEGGSFEVRVKIPEGTSSGNVTVSARGYLESEIKSLPSFWYASQAELNQLVQDLNDGTKSLQSVLSETTNRDYINLNLQLDCWNSALASKVSALLSGVDFADVGDVKERVYFATVITLAKEKEAADAVEFLKEADSGYPSRISILKLDSVAEELFISNDDIALFAAENMDKSAATVDAVVEDFQKKIALGALNEADNWGELNKALTTYASLLELDTEQAQEYDDFTSDSDISSYVGKKLINMLPISTTESLYKKFEDAVEDAKDKPSKNTSTGRGSGGGGGGTVTIGSSAKTEESNIDNSIKDTSLSYSDLQKSHWAYDSIMAMTEEGIVNGYDDGCYYPEKTVTREEFVKMLVLATGLDISVSEALPYTDVSESDWFYPYVAVARKNGLVMGVTEDRFGSGSVITREQMATICYRAAKLTGKNFANETTIDFPDKDTISEYAKEAVQVMSAAGILKGMGDGTFMPLGNVTRAQAAHVIFDIYRTKGE